MAYLRESEVRKAARTDRRVIAKSMDSAKVLRESVEQASVNDTFDVFLCHSIRDAELVMGSKLILEAQNLSVYVDWITDPHMERDAITPETAKILRSRMQQISKPALSLFEQL